MKFLAVDLGASSGRTIVGTLDGEGISLEETHRFENGPVLRDGYKRWDVPRLLEEIKAGIARSGPVDGIGLDTWGVDYGYLDADGELLDLPCSYRDDRHVNVPEKVYERIDKERLYSITGTQEMSINTIFQVYADKLQRPELFARARKLLLMPDLLRYLLTGEMCAEYTICSTSEFLDARKRTWSQEILDALEIPRELFPDVSMPGVPAGTYEGTPVYLVGGHDTASAVAAVPATGDGDWAYLSSGTWSLIGAELREPVLTPEASAASFTNEGGIGGTIRFLKNVNGLWLLQECRRIWAEQGQDLSFAEIAAAAKESTYRGLIDPNDPRFMAPDDMVREIAAACAEAGYEAPGSVADYALCCYQSLAAAYRREFEGLRQVTGRAFDRLHVVGGGCRAELLNQLTADALQVPVIAGPAEATAIGNLALQAMANGQVRNLPEVRERIAGAFPLTTYEPRA